MNGANPSVFLSGLLSGIGIFIRLTGIFGATAILLAAVKKGTKSVVVFLGGIACSVLLYLLFIMITKISLKEVFVYGLADNFGSGSITNQTIFWKLDNLVNGMFHTEMVLFLPGIIGYLLIKRKPDIFVSWFILSFIGINIIGLYARSHFRELLPSLSMVTAVAIMHVVNAEKIKLKHVIIATWICFFPKELEPLLALKGLIVKPEHQKIFCAGPAQRIDDEDKKRLGIWTRENTRDTDYAYVAGMSAIVQAYSQRISPSIYFNIVQTERAVNRLMYDLNAHQPEYILIPNTRDYLLVGDSTRNFVAHLAEKNYTYQGCQYSYSIYRRKW